MVHKITSCQVVVVGEVGIHHHHHHHQPSIINHQSSNIKHQAIIHNQFINHTPSAQSVNPCYRRYVHAYSDLYFDLEFYLYLGRKWCIRYPVLGAVASDEVGAGGCPPPLS